MKIIIIEGTDNVGKDTVINRLTYEFNNSNIYHCEKPKSETPEKQAEEQEMNFAELLGKTLYEYTAGQKIDEDEGSYCLIHNRSWYGEYVYGCMYRDNVPMLVKDMIHSLEKCLTTIIKPEDLCFITLLSNNADFLVRNDDGLSISNADKGKIIHETKRFEEIFKESIIENKHIVYVNDGDKFRDKADIYNEILGYIFNDKAEDNKEAENKLSINDFPGLKAVKDELLKKGWKRVINDIWLSKHGLTKEQYDEIINTDEINDNIYKKYVYTGSKLSAEELYNIHAGNYKYE